MAWTPNPKRIREIFDEEKVTRAAQAVLTLRQKGVLAAIAFGWGLVLVMLFTCVFVLRLALTIPLWR